MLKLVPRKTSDGCCRPEVPPTSRPLFPTSPEPVTPGVMTPAPSILCAAGSASSTSRVNTLCLVRLCTSTRGVAPATVIVSSSDPTFSSTLTLAVKSPINSMPSRFTVVKPGSVKVTL